MSLKLSYKRNSLKVFVSKTTMPRALIYAMYNNLVVSYEDLSNYAPSVKGAPTGEHLFYTIFLLQTQGLEL